MFLEVAVKLKGFVKDLGLVKALQAIVAIMGLPDETRLLMKGGALLQITTVAIVCVSLVAIIEVTSGAFLRL